jgi:hypothetical protein
VEDVRPVLQFYSQFDNPMAEFRRRAQMLGQQEVCRAYFGVLMGENAIKCGNMNN